MSDSLARLRAEAEPPSGAALRALWHELRGEWEAAHALVDTPRDAAECRVHAFLHRVEGDAWNAAYWYREAGTRTFQGSLEAERAALASALAAAEGSGSCGGGEV